MKFPIVQGPGLSLDQGLLRQVATRENNPLAYMLQGIKDSQEYAYKQEALGLEREKVGLKRQELETARQTALAEAQERARKAAARAKMIESIQNRKDLTESQKATATYMAEFEKAKELGDIVKSMSPEMRNLIETEKDPIAKAMLMAGDYDAYNDYYENDPERAAKLAAAKAKTSETQRFVPGGTYLDKNGKLLGVGWHDKITGTSFIEVQGTGEKISIPEGARKITTGDLNKFGLMSAKEFRALETEVQDEERSLRKMLEYVGAREDAGQGVDLWLDKLIGAAKTAIDAGVDWDELRVMESQGRLQGMVGALRLETVGPGPVTEYDAARILMATGGDINILQNKSAMRRLMLSHLKDKYERWTTNSRHWNAVLETGHYNMDYFEPVDTKVKGDYKKAIDKLEKQVVRDEAEAKGEKAFPEGTGKLVITQPDGSEVVRRGTQEQLDAWLKNHPDASGRWEPE